MFSRPECGEDVPGYDVGDLDDCPNIMDRAPQNNYLPLSHFCIFEMFRESA